MKFSSLIFTIICLLLKVVSIEGTEQKIYPPDAVDILAAKSLPKLAEYLRKTNSSCTLENAVKRREWGDLSPKERIEYTNAVLCLRSKPPLSPLEIVPGARSRYDDFIAAHMNQTLTIHATGNFLSWHRYFVWIYEKALREECGYKGYQPYWNWGRYASDPINSPLFDGSPSSLSGNGLYYNYSGVPILGGVIPPSVGGGCITTGPFANSTMNLGPLAATVPDVPANPLPNGYGYNPRCIRRDVNVNSAAVTHTNYTYALITDPGNADIYWFQTVMQGQFDLGLWGVHTGGHFTIGGDPGGDFFTSPGDPAFWLHHGMIDRVWWIWQLQDLPSRLKAVSGTLTIFNEPPSRNATLDDIVELGYSGGEEVRLGDLLDANGGLGGSLCYVYV